MKIPGLNLAEFVRKLGSQRAGWLPELADVIQPVALISDATAIVPPLHPPRALLGLKLAQSATEFPCFSFHSRAPGGTWIRWLAITSTNVSTLGLYIGGSTPFEPPPFNPEIFNTFTARVMSMGGPPIVGSLIGGDTPGITFGVPYRVPTLALTAGGRITWPTSFFIKPGEFLFGEFDQLNATPRVEMIVEEVPVKAADVLP